MRRDHEMLTRVGRPGWRSSAAFVACAGALTIAPGCGNDESAPVAPTAGLPARLTAIMKGCTHQAPQRNPGDCVREEVGRAVDSGELPESYRRINSFVVLPGSSKIEMGPVKKGRGPAP